jgi:histidine ammonia-lyase
MIHQITTNQFSIEQLKEIIYRGCKLALSPECKEKITACRKYLDDKIKASTAPIYGINTGFGSLYKKNINAADLEKLQDNLVKSHACGMGEEVPLHVVRIMLLLKIQSLSYGFSGVQLKTVERLIDFYNNDILPVVYQQGSLGASGDLAPLAHLSLPLIGLGEVYYGGRKISGKELNELMNWEPVHFKAKEGLALLNGTQFMSAYGIWCLLESHRLSRLADLIAATSLDAFDGRIEPFDERIHLIRPHQGQLETAAIIRNLLQGSQIIIQPKIHVQDPYSFRCIPQVHGASKDTLAFVTQTLLTEINAVTDNPNIFPDDDTILSGGNFHGQPLALALDYLGIAMAELGNISERRTYQLISGQRELPDFLVANPGLNSGLMIPQYTAASIVSQNKQLCTPASVDSIVSSNGQEDHVSMGSNAATKALKIVENVEKLLAIELLTATQAIEFRRPLRSSDIIEDLLSNFRLEVPFIENDRIFHHDMVKAVTFLKNYRIDALTFQHTY